MTISRAGKMVWPTPQHCHGIGWNKPQYKALQHPHFANWTWGLRRELSCSPESPHEGIHSIIEQTTPEMDRRPGIGPRAEKNRDALREQAARILQAEFDHQINMQAQDLAVHNPRVRGLPGPPIIPNEAFRTQLGAQYFSSTTDVAMNIPPGFPPPQMIARSAEYPDQPQQTTVDPHHLPPALLVQPHIYEPQTSSTRSQIAHQGDARDQISSSNFAVLAERAARRNGSGGFEHSKVNTSESRQDHQGHLPHDIFGITSPSPQRATQYATYNLNSTSASPTFDLQPTQTRPERAPRLGNFDRGLGYGLGLDSNMPSQLPRNPQEAAAASRQHAARVRAMQRTLASDPNVMMRRAPGASSQLVAMGPPLTGHDTTTSTTLPSVLNPISRQPMMTYKQGLQAIFDETGPLLLRLTQLEPRPVSVVLYDTLGRPLNVSEGLILNKESDVKAVVTVIQQLLDEACDNDPTHDGSRLIVKVIEIRVGIADGAQGYPPLKGICVQGEKGQRAKWIKWATHGDMEKYWEAYRIMLQTQAQNPGSMNTVAKPIFKVTTVRQLDNNGSYPGGHEFYDVSDVVPPPPPAIVADGPGPEDVDGRLESTDGGADTSSEISAGSFAFRSESSLQTAVSKDKLESASQAAPSQGFGRLQLFDGAASNPDSRGGGSGSDGSDGPEASEPKEKTKPVDPTKNWGYYQRMGGDPRMHKLYDLSHVPFDINPEKVPAPKFSFTTPDILVTIKDAWSDNGTEGSQTPKASDADGRAPYEYVDKAWREYAVKELAAISFEDDDIYFPNADVKIPTQNDLLASRLSGHSKQKEKPKAKEIDVSHFFNDHCAPDGSQDHLLDVRGYDSSLHGGKGKANEAGDNSPYGGYAVPDNSHDNSFGFPGYELPTYEGKGKPTQADEVSNQYLVPNYGQQSSPMRAETASKGKSAHTKVSSMNVHAAPFPNFNYPQAGQGVNTNTSSPYLQSLAGSQPAACIRYNPYGNMTGQARSSTPLLQYGSPSMTGNQAASIKKSNSSLALHAPNFKPNLNSQAFHPQPSSPSTLLQFPESKFGSSNASLVPRYTSPEKSMFTSTGASPVPKHSSPDKAMLFNTATYEHRRRSPDKQHTQKSSRRRQKSPEKPRGQDAAQTGVLRLPSPDKSNHQQGFSAGSHYVHNTGAGFPLLQYSSADTFNTQHGLDPKSGFQHGQNAQHSFDFNFQLPSQGFANNGGQGAVYSGGIQGLSNIGVQGAMQVGGQVSDQTGGRVSAQGGGQSLSHSRGGSWIYRGAKMPKREFGF